MDMMTNGLSRIKILGTIRAYTNNTIVLIMTSLIVNQMLIILSIKDIATRKLLADKTIMRLDCRLGRVARHLWFNQLGCANN